MANHKVILSGPAGSGKSAAIAAISDIEPFHTLQVAADAVPERSPASAAALDYGRLTLDNRDSLHLYATGGETHLDFNWDGLDENGLGLVLLIDNQRPDPIGDLQTYLNRFPDCIRRNAVAVGVTRTDVTASPSIADFQRVLLQRQLNVPVFEVDARESHDVTMLLQALLYGLDPCVEH